MVTFIRKHPILLQNLSWETRGSHESLWDQLASELNDSGPPLKDVATWKKALKDWKRFIIKKVAKNELHNIPLATGLSSAEETIASLCRLNDDVNQMIINASEDELQDTSNTAFDMDDVEDIVPEDIDHNAALQDTAGYTYEPDDCKEQADIDPLYVQSAKRSAQLESRSIHKELQAMSKKITTISEATDGTKNALSEFCALYKKKLTEDARHHAAMEQLLAEKNALKKQLLELEQRKLLK
ncbi:uncharacterized protein LOC108602363 isoform X2 [Drosophila busckii]|nr:uncharacterized protein LOC108602363 isoform X2 [Drosophila busckii]